MIKDTLYAKYILERQGLSILENEHSFIFFKINSEECFIAEMFLQEEARGKGQARELIQTLSKIAIDQNCKFITGNIHLQDPGATHTVGAAIGVGFKIVRAENGVILIMKDLGG